MIAKSQLLDELESLPKECYEEVMDFVGYLKLKRIKEISQTMLLSEKSLAEDWDTPEEDAAWINL